GADPELVVAVLVPAVAAGRRRAAGIGLRRGRLVVVEVAAVRAAVLRAGLGALVVAHPRGPRHARRVVGVVEEAGDRSGGEARGLLRDGPAGRGRRGLARGP